MFVDKRAMEKFGPGSALDLYPQFRMPQRYHDRVLRFVDKLARSQEYNWFVAVAPRSGDATVAAFTSIEHEFNVVPGSMLWGLSSVSDQAAGFRFELWDRGKDVPVAISKATNGSLSGDIGASTFGAPVPFIFDQPYIITGTGLVSIKITNLASVANALQLAMFIAQPQVPMEAKCRRN